MALFFASCDSGEIGGSGVRKSSIDEWKLYKGAKLSIEKSVFVLPLPSEIMLTISAITDGCVFGADYKLEKRTGDAWQEILPGESEGIVMGVPDVKHELSKGGEMSFPVYLERFGLAEIGEYRIVKSVLHGDEKEYLVVPFRIIDQ